MTTTTAPTATTRTFTLATFVLTVGVGCSEPYDDAGTPELEACEHAKDGPAAAATASAEDSEAAPDVTAEHTRHDVVLVGVDGGNGGFVRFESAGGEHVVFLTADIPIVFADAQGNAIDEELQTIEDTCREVVTSHHVELPVGIVSIGFGPTSETEVSMVIEAAAHEEEAP